MSKTAKTPEPPVPCSFGEPWPGRWPEDHPKCVAWIAQQIRTLEQPRLFP